MARSKTNDGDAGDHSPAPKGKPKPRRFETALEEIETIVDRLEGGQLDLGESLEAYRKGIETLQECHQLLSAAERKVTLLSGFDAEGNPVTAAFDEAEMTLDEKQKGRGARRGLRPDPADDPGLF